MDNIQALKQLVNIAVESLEIITISEVMLRVNKSNEDLKQREKHACCKERIQSKLAHVYRNYAPISINGGTWCRQAYIFLGLSHQIHYPFEKSPIEITM